MRSLCQRARRSMWLMVNSSLITSWVSRLVYPFSWVAKGSPCQARVLSIIVHDGQPIVKPHSAAPDWINRRLNSSTSCQVSGGRSGSRPAWATDGLSQDRAGLDEVKGTEERWPAA